MYRRVSEVTTMFHTTLTPGTSFANPRLPDPNSQCPQPVSPERSSKRQLCVTGGRVVKTSSGLAAPRSPCSEERHALGRGTCSAGAPGVGSAVSLPAVTWGLARSSLPCLQGTALWAAVAVSPGERAASPCVRPHFRFAFCGGAAPRVGEAPNPSCRHGAMPASCLESRPAQPHRPTAWFPRGGVPTVLGPSACSRILGSGHGSVTKVPACARSSSLVRT